MSILDTLREQGGCQGGRTIYYAAKSAASIANLGRDERKLKPETICRLKKLFPKLDLSKVTFNINCELPGNWYKDGVEAMTFGYKIYFRGSGYQRDTAKMQTLIHELVHVDQVRRFGSEWAFACEYGKGYVAAGNSYEKNPLEKEAIDFVSNNPVPPPCKYHWMMSRDGAKPWEKLAQSGYRLKDLAFGDFTGNGKADIFRANGRDWYISIDGVSSWRKINQSSYLIKDLFIGDFTGNGKLDVFRADGRKWYISVDGVSSWKKLNSSSYGLHDLAFGDFTGNRKTDVFRADGTNWYISEDGVRPWKKINTSAFGLDDLAFGDFTGNGKTDVFRADGHYWYISEDGVSPWKKINKSVYRLDNLAFADFTGNGKTDVFTARYLIN